VLFRSWTGAIRPTLADYKGDAYFFSTPKGLNYFYSLWTMGGDRDDWMRWQYTTYDNPFIPPDEIDAMRQELPERVFRQEILAEFLEDGAYFQGVDKAAVIDKPDEPWQHAGHSLLMGVDWAITNDYTVITVGCRECNRVVDWDRFNQIDFTYQRERLYALARRWGVNGCLPERNSIGLPNIEIIREFVPMVYGPDGQAGYNTTASTKPPLIQGLATAIEHKGFLVPKAAAEELRIYEVTLSTNSNNLRFSAPEGMHDDWVISLALLWYAMSAPIWLFT